MPNINMMCDRCHEGENAEWDEELGCYLCAKCRAAETNVNWSGSPCPDDPDNFWIDDVTGERVNAATGERANADHQ